MALRTYDRKSHQRRVYFANSETGTLDPPMVAEFKNGVGTFVFPDEMDGKTVAGAQPLVGHHVRVLPSGLGDIDGWGQDLDTDLEFYGYARELRLPGDCR